MEFMRAVNPMLKIGIVEELSMQALFAADTPQIESHSRCT
jgi:hypothetical protein